MPEAAVPPQSAAVSALVEVTARDASPSRGGEAMAGLADAVRAAGEASMALVWVVDPRDGRGCVAAAVGISPEDAGRLAEAVAPFADSGAEHEVSASDEGPLASELRRLGVAAALAVSVPIAEAPGGVCLLAGPRPPATDPLRRHAVRVGAGRIGALLDLIRLRDSVERAMAQILASDERMLGRIGLDIHDGPTQQLSVALLEVQLLEAELGEEDGSDGSDPQALRASLGRIYETVGGALHEMRELIGHLRPAQFEERSLRDILQDAITAFESRADCRVAAEWEGDFPVNGVSISQRITLYRILQETLTNAHRHGRASVVRVRVRGNGAGTTLEVRDDGCGFDPEAVQRRRPGTPLARFGLHGMRDRAQLLGGTFAVESAPGQGTTIRVFLPRWSGPPSEVVVDVA
jgi:signal transduction histidine kinase